MHIHLQRHRDRSFFLHECLVILPTTRFFPEAERGENQQLGGYLLTWFSSVQLEIRFGMDMSNL